MRVGITGNRGFIGSNLVKYLEQYKKYKIIKYDFRLEYIGALERFVMYSDTIVHLAGKNKGSDLEIINNNLIHTKNLLDYCMRWDRPIIIAGADYKKNNAYKASKDTIDLLCKSYSYIGLDSLVLNIPKVFGPGCRPNYNSFVTTLIYLASKDKLDEGIKLIKNMDEELELIHVNDLCKQIEQNLDNIKGYRKLNFTENDVLIRITFEELVNILNGKSGFLKCEDIIHETEEWYRQNDIS